MGRGGNFLDTFASATYVYTACCCLEFWVVLLIYSNKVKTAKFIGNKYKLT